MSISRAIVATFVLTLSGCATMNKDECMSADWRALGYQQGSNGGGTQNFSRLQKDCANHGISANFEAFQQGHREGLDNYCSYDQGLASGQNGHAYNTQCSRVRYPAYSKGYSAGVKTFCVFENGFKAGADGKAFHNQCREEGFVDYQQGYDDGLKKLQLGKDIKNLTLELDDIDSDIKKYRDSIAFTKDILVSETATTLQREQALKDLEIYQAQYDEAEDHYHALEAKLQLLQLRYNRW